MMMISSEEQPSVEEAARNHFQKVVVGIPVIEDVDNDKDDSLQPALQQQQQHHHHDHDELLQQQQQQQRTVNDNDENNNDHASSSSCESAAATEQEQQPPTTQAVLDFIDHEERISVVGQEERTPDGDLVRMEKDPLGLGIPFPMIVRNSRNSITRNTSLVQEEERNASEEAAAAGIRNKISSTTAPPGLDRQSSMPGSYAIVGPLDANCSETLSETTEAVSNDSSSSTRSSMDAAVLVEATVVPDQDHNDDEDVLVRLEDGSTAFHATSIRAAPDPHHVLAEAKPMQGIFFVSHKMTFLACLVVVTVVLGLSLGLALRDYSHGESDDEVFPEVSATAPALGARRSILDQVLESGVLRCGTCNAVRDFSNFLAYAHAVNHGNQTSSHFVSNYVSKLWRCFGLYVCAWIYISSGFASLAHSHTLSLSLRPRCFGHQCSAVAAAILGDKDAFVVVHSGSRDEKYAQMANNSVDLMIHREPISMAQDVHVEEVGSGLAYTVPYLYSGMAFTGLPKYVECADNDLQTYGECSDLKICIHPSSSLAQILKVRIPQTQLVLIKQIEKVFEGFLEGQCNVIATEASSLAASVLQSMGYTGELAAGTKEHTNEMWAMTSLDHDPEWADRLNAVTMALLAAQKAGITQETAEKMGQTSLLGEENKDFFIDAVRAAGNFAEIYDFFVPLEKRNLFNDGTTGLLATPELGAIDLDYLAHHHKSDGPMTADTLKNVLERGVIQCGVRGNRPGFALYDANSGTWHGMDVDLCTAIAASLFGGEFDSVEFHDVGSSGASSGFVMLQNGVVDVLAGAEWTLQNDMNEATTNAGYSFTQPYFYGPKDDARFEENLALATRQDDSRWSSFVYWTAQSLVLAEERGIWKETSFQMPLIECFGVDLQRIFRDAVNAVGNYAQVYERHLSDILPRGGRNMLNLVDTQGRGALRYIPPGFLL